MTTVGRRSPIAEAANPSIEVANIVAAVEERQDALRQRLQELTLSRLESLEGLFISRVEGLSTVIQAQIKCLEELGEERFVTVQKQLDGVELRRAEYKADTKSAVEAAFAAARDAVREQATASDKAISKSESAFGGQIMAVDATVSDLKDRIAKLETRTATSSENRVDNRASLSSVVGVAGAIIAFIAVIATIILANLGTVHG